jgi:bifunctional UDP-N-acetylglucosamine pyrophosphorylase / glucosamine-1-phosphate N-acetyltransferase
MNNVSAIILAAGRGTRMKSTTVNKVMSLQHGSPLIYYSITRLVRAGLNPIIVVVGFAKESVIDYVNEKFNKTIIFADQGEVNGTAKAVEAGLVRVPDACEYVLTVHGDDSYLYDPSLLQELIKTHISAGADVTMLTAEKEDPSGLGRIMRDGNGVVQGIVEEKVATPEQKKITEVNTGCFIFRKAFISEYIRKIQKNPVAQEYYLTDIIELARTYGKKIETHAGGNIPWQGINRPEDLETANKIPNAI